MTDDVHEVYAVRYAHHDRQASENFIGGDPHDILQPLAYYVWAIAGPHGTFVVDTGFDRAMADKRGRIIVKPIDEGLAAIGIKADAVEDVIVTHLHYDHCGNHDLFPRARYHLQDEEMAYATGRYMRHAHMRVPFETDDVVAMVRKVFADRVVFHDGADEIAPGITVHRIGGHSKGLQCLRVKTRRGHVVLAADASHLYSHINEGRVFPVTFNVGDVLEGYRTIKRLADSIDHIVPGHDPLVAKIYPAAASGLEGLVVRLDVAPKRVG
jgi:glyoxylase-like metal-dependent hydrolase (beta-lactamase superfamily II)